MRASAFETDVYTIPPIGHILETRIGFAPMLTDLQSVALLLRQRVIIMVATVGFEPTTQGFSVPCSTRLSYIAIKLLMVRPAESNRSPRCSSESATVTLTARYMVRVRGAAPRTSPSQTVRSANVSYTLKLGSPDRNRTYHVLVNSETLYQ